IAVHYQLLLRFPDSLRAAFESHALRETPKESNPAFARSQFELLLGLHELTHAAHHACEAQGYVCVCDHSTDNWPVEKAADYLLALLRRHASAEERAGRRRSVAVLADGELSS